MRTLLILAFALLLVGGCSTNHQCSVWGGPNCVVGEGDVVAEVTTRSFETSQASFGDVLRVMRESDREFFGSGGKEGGEPSTSSGEVEVGDASGGGSASGGTSSDSTVSYRETRIRVASGEKHIDGQQESGSGSSEGSGSSDSRVSVITGAQGSAGAWDAAKWLGAMVMTVLTFGVF